MKIPTLLGIAIIIAIASSAALYYFKQTPEKKSVLEINAVKAVNIFNTSVTLVWETSTPTVGTVSFGESENLNSRANDNRDRFDPRPRLTHFVTLNNLKPDTRYFYKLDNDGITHPQKALEFKTASIESSDDLDFSFIKPLKGTILNTNLNPVDESLIFLEIPGAQDLATFSSTAGNFILPLREVLNKDLNQKFFIPEETPATLRIKKDDLSSEVKILISETQVNLPPITIGNNLDLSNYKSQPITKITFTQSTQTKYDFNNDQKINSLDLAILREKTASKTILDIDEQEQFDINSDGIVDQKDIDAFSKALTGN